jgi:N-acetylglucosamine-6-phosphate deacetylase
LEITGRLVESAKVATLVIDGQTIRSMAYVDAGTPVDEDNWIAPAFFDVQVNGFAGIDFNTPGLSAEQIAHAIAKLQETGVAAFCPTVVTESIERMCACLSDLDRGCQAAGISSSIPAFHLEGPWISSEDGPRGAHPAEHTRAADWEEFLRLQECAGGRIGMVTLAPEVPGALPTITRLVEAGIVAAIGHTAAEPSVIRDAIRAGATMATHLGNGCHLSLPRHHNYIWEQLASDELWASFIVDGHHLPPSVVKCLIRAKGWKRTILTSDAVSAAGMQPGRHHVGNIEVVVNPDYRVERADRVGAGILAGSALCLLRGVENVMRFVDISLQEAMAMASTNPAAMMGLSHRFGKIEAGREATLIVFTWKHQSKSLHLRQMIKGGEVVVDRSADAVA